MPAQHTLARARAPALGQLLEQPLVMFPRRILPSLHDAVLALYQRHGRVPRIAQEAIQMQTIVNLVWGGLGMAWVPQSVTSFRRAGVVYRPAADFVAETAGTARRRASSSIDFPACETSLVWPAGDIAPALVRFVEFVRGRSR
jgi:DNA-binding transcriptional LysR family regulator